MVMPSREEAFGVAVLEAAACARPTIACRVGVCPKCFVTARPVCWLPPAMKPALAEVLIRLARDPETCRRLGESGRKMIQESSFE